MRHMLEQFGPALELPWTNRKAPELTNDLIEKMVSGTLNKLRKISKRTGKTERLMLDRNSSGVEKIQCRGR